MTSIQKALLKTLTVVAMKNNDIIKHSKNRMSGDTTSKECLGIQQEKNAWGCNEKRMPGDIRRKECLGYSKNGISGDIVKIECLEIQQEQNA